VRATGNHQTHGITAMQNTTSIKDDIGVRPFGVARTIPPPAQ
jgi:hypothetical protein